MSNPLVKKDLVDAILELREDVERQLKANKYYIALHKLDELLAAITPLDIVEATAEPAPAPTQTIETAPTPEAAGEEVMSFHGVVEQPVSDGSFTSHEARA
ncbi:MAG: hypothetical protein WA717_00650 [Methyloceanibacter sp.]|jgi:hypothetical protein